MLYVLGHQNPDTDSVCSAIVYAYWLNQKGKKAEAVALGEVNKETEYVLNKWKMEKPSVIKELPVGSQIILMDHNEESQSIKNRAQLELVEIIDHHKVKLETDKPISICIKPWGSSCSIVAEKFWEEKMVIPSDIAGLLIAGIISDTLYFRSPTTTEKDKEIVEKLNKIAKIDNLEEFSLAMFKAKSDLGDIATEDLIKLDYKEFDFNGHRWGIGVMETTDKEFGLKRKEEIMRKLAEIKEKENLESVIFTIVDILNEKSWTLASDEATQEIFQEVFSAREELGALAVDKLVSRKKQIVPQLEKYFNG